MLRLSEKLCSMKHLITTVKILFVSLLFALSACPVMAQTKVDPDILHINSLIKAGKIEQAHAFAKEKYQATSTSDTSFLDAVITLFLTDLECERLLRLQEDFSKSMEINQELLKIIQQYKKYFVKEFADQEFFVYRNLTVCHTGLKEYDNAQKYRKLLYKAQKKGKLPCEYNLCQYFNFDFFKVDTLNVWGYEWYDQLPKNRFSSSFTKIVYYVYNTDSLGNDKDLLYRLHVLMFHGTGQPFDYIMDKRISTEKGEISGSMYAYTYQEDIDFEKLHNDVLEIVRENKQTDTRRFNQGNAVNIQIKQ